MGKWFTISRPSWMRMKVMMILMKMRTLVMMVMMAELPLSRRSRCESFSGPPLSVRVSVVGRVGFWADGVLSITARA